jgi:hypothetical protein
MRVLVTGGARFHRLAYVGSSACRRRLWRSITLPQACASEKSPSSLRGAGLLGSHLCDRLLADGHEVLCVDTVRRRIQAEYFVPFRLGEIGGHPSRRDVSAWLTASPKIVCGMPSMATRAASVAEAGQHFKSIWDSKRIWASSCNSHTITTATASN